MKTNQIKKGTRIQLNNGWYGTMMDNARGNRRLVEVEGFATETGSIYAWDIAYVVDHVLGRTGRYSFVHNNAVHTSITLTEAQVIAKQNVEMILG